MKTLILNGSPRKNGDTATLIHEMKQFLIGDVFTVSSYYDAISPCLDCRYCWTHAGCCIDDDMQQVYQYIEQCDNIVLSSPIYFSELTGSLLALLSRLQTYFASGYFRSEPANTKKKHGVLLLVGAQKNTYEKAASTAHTLFRYLNALPVVANVFSLDTDHTKAADDTTALAQAKDAALLLNRLYQSEH